MEELLRTRGVEVVRAGDTFHVTNGSLCSKMRDIQTDCDNFDCINVHIYSAKCSFSTVEIYARKCHTKYVTPSASYNNM